MYTTTVQKYATKVHVFTVLLIFVYFYADNNQKGKFIFIIKSGYIWLH